MPILLVLIAVVVGLWFFGILNFNVNDTGELPNVSIEGGRAPDVDVDIQVPDVDVTTEERTVTVPQVEVNPSENSRE
ncbi:hypothetical protein [Aurantimonas sp. HBX-1]|uniref:hypothetical protein n=1 Tax=Aurantimonas sp. HBX-1 TaxID=2906072 RepID=UPI001F1ED0A4|nr:hypothetical protein [Aurantimonas sp. HBX-1]UIJ73363.1 hypothetical protein LXB15_06920 [Aurantimonas sp. HBX-1]